MFSGDTERGHYGNEWVNLPLSCTKILLHSTVVGFNTLDFSESNKELEI